uniref:Uncharacterized protein n=1 Tax=Odontella aurita TaxID=265563 RepID=A0A7S4I651_9STRA
MTGPAPPRHGCYIEGDDGYNDGEDLNDSGAEGGHRARAAAREVWAVRSPLPFAERDRFERTCYGSPKQRAASEADGDRLAEVDEDEEGEEELTQIETLYDVRRVHETVEGHLQAGKYARAIAVLSDNLLPSLKLMEQLEEKFRDKYDQRGAGAEGGGDDESTGSAGAGAFPYRELIASALRNVGVLQMWVGSFEDAINTFLEAMQHDPNDATPLSYLGLLMCATRRTDDARKIFLRALLMIERGEQLSQAPSGSRNAGPVAPEERTKLVRIAKGILLNNMGWCFLKTEELEKANGTFRRALGMLLENGREHERRRGGTEAGGTPAAGGRTNTAKAEQHGGDLPLSRFCIAITMCNMGAILGRTKELDVAVQALEPAAELFKSIPGLDKYFVITTLNAIALINATLKNLNNALTAYERILDYMDSKAAEGVCADEDAVLTLGKMRLIYRELKDAESVKMCLRMIVTRHNMAGGGADVRRNEASKTDRGEELSNLIIELV